MNKYEEMKRRVEENQAIDNAIENGIKNQWTAAQVVGSLKPQIRNLDSGRVSDSYRFEQLRKMAADKEKQRQTTSAVAG